MTLKSSTVWIKGLAIASMVLAVGACAATESTPDNPILRKFQWFSYLEGGDFKEACTAGAPGRYRMIYNGVYTEQVRVYDLRADTGALDARLILPMDLRDFSVGGFPDLLNPWRGQSVAHTLNDDEVASVLAALDADGAFGPPAVGLELPSMGFFWTIATCHEGVYHFTGLAWPSAAWDAVRFDDVLFAADPFPTPVNAPRKTRLKREPHSGQRYNIENEFIVKVGEDGLAGL